MLSKENKKFIYGLIREGGRAKDYESAIMWLSDCGLVHKVSRVTAGRLPLKAYEDMKAFVDKFAPDVAIRTSMQNYKKEARLINLPLYAIANLKKEL